MSKEINICISKLLNWHNSTSNPRLEVSFYTSDSKTYLAHKSTVGYVTGQTLILNTSFCISFSSQSNNIVLCKISDLSNRTQPIHICEVQINLDILQDRKQLYLPVSDHNKVLQVRIIEDKIEDQGGCFETDQDKIKEMRENFLQERYNFLDKIKEREINHKKKFSQNVYNLLKDLKGNKIIDSKFDKQRHQSLQKDKNSYQYKKYDQYKHHDPKRKSQNINQKEDNHRKAERSPTKYKANQDLLINSLKNKAGFEEIYESRRQKITVEDEFRTPIINKHTIQQSKFSYKKKPNEMQQ